MRKIFILTLVFAISTSLSFAQKTGAKNTPSASGTSSKKTESTSDVPQFDEIIISGGVGAGAVVSTNIINSGALLPASIEFMLRYKRNRYGLGVTNELYLTPENLGKMFFGESSNVKKIYFMHEITIFKRSFINLGLSTQLGWFYVGDERTDMESDKARYFGSTGPILELGTYKWQFYVRPALEYKSYDIGSWHKEIIGQAMIGLRYKIPAE